MSHRSPGPFVVVALAVMVAGANLSAQSRPKAHWLMDGYDKERTSWQRNETLLSPDTVGRMKLLWKVRLDNQPRQMHNLFPALIVGDVATAQGPRELAIVAGVSDNIYGIDVERGTQIWKRQFDSTFKDDGSSRAYVLCPGGLTATPIVVPTATPGKYTVYAISWDGRLRALDAATGEETAPAEPFLPPNGKPYGLNYHDNVLYTTTAQGCGGNPNQFYSYDLATRKVGSFDPGSGGLWPRLGPSIGRDGRVYAGSGDGDYFPDQQIFGQAIIAAKQNPATKAMEMQDWFAPANAFWLRKRDLDMNVTGPVFEYKGREYTAQSSKECRIWLLDTSALGGEDHRTPVHQTPLVCNDEVHFAGAGPWGALATWEDTDGTRWVLMPFWGPKHPKFTAPIEYGEVGVRRGGRIQAPDPRDRATAHARMAVAQHDQRRSGGHRQRRRVRLRQRRGRDAGIGRHRPGVQLGGQPHQELIPRDVIRAGCAHRRGTVVERRSDCDLQPLHQHVRRQRTRVHRHVRRDSLLLRP